MCRKPPRAPLPGCPQGKSLARKGIVPLTFVNCAPTSPSYGGLGEPPAFCARGGWVGHLGKAVRRMAWARVLNPRHAALAVASTARGRAAERTFTNVCLLHANLENLTIVRKIAQSERPPGMIISYSLREYHISSRRGLTGCLSLTIGNPEPACGISRARLPRLFRSTLS